MLQQPNPGDYVIATGRTHSVREFCEVAFNEVGLDYRDYIKVDPAFYRPSEVELLVGDSTKARAELGWKPTYTFRELVREMVLADLQIGGRRSRNFDGFPSTGKGVLDRAGNSSVLTA
jgi:GDPmannose 4,6-dehydratase